MRQVDHGSCDLTGRRFTLLPARCRRTCQCTRCVQRVGSAGSESFIRPYCSLVTIFHHQTQYQNHSGLPTGSDCGRGISLFTVPRWHKIPIHVLLMRNLSFMPCNSHPLQYNQVLPLPQGLYPVPHTCIDIHPHGQYLCSNTFQDGSQG